MRACKGRTSDSEGETPTTTVHTRPLCDHNVLHTRGLFAASASASSAPPRVGAAVLRSSSLIEHRTTERRTSPHGCLVKVKPSSSSSCLASSQRVFSCIFLRLLRTAAGSGPRLESRMCNWPWTDWWAVVRVGRRRGGANLLGCRSYG